MSGRTDNAILVVRLIAWVICGFVTGSLVAVGFLVVGSYCGVCSETEETARKVTRLQSYLWPHAGVNALFVGPRLDVSVYRLRIARAVAENGAVYALAGFVIGAVTAFRRPTGDGGVGGGGGVSLRK